MNEILKICLSSARGTVICRYLEKYHYLPNDSSAGEYGSDDYYYVESQFSKYSSMSGKCHDIKSGDDVG